ncbi:LCP family protein [Nonomuraea sp. NPDC049152]|uniref:LCP family protein n=1 Tax=Nonomuraea sp. NPDC049152 TaxID=3154350 RepID=UPI0033E38BB9
MRWKWLLLGVAGVVAATLGGFYWRLDSGLRTAPMPTGPRPAKVAAAELNILVLGSDTRGHGNRAYGGGKVETPRADTTILLNVAADRHSATAVSLPRDTVVPRPACGPHPASRTEPLNWAFAYGGAACTIATVERVTGIRIDHFVVLDFAGVAELSSAVGGVTVTVPTGIDPRHADGLRPGRQKVKGRAAVAFLRLRHVGADQSDLQRIKRQQEFLRSFVHQVKAVGPVQVAALSQEPGSGGDHGRGSWQPCGTGVAGHGAARPRPFARALPHPAAAPLSRQPSRLGAVHTESHEDLACAPEIMINPSPRRVFVPYSGRPHARSVTSCRGAC